MRFQLLSEICSIETIARGSSVRMRDWLSRRYGRGTWRKMKGIAEVMYPNGRICLAEVHWFEAHGIGRRKLKIKRTLRDL